jgi:hypothetical protein
MRQIGSVVTPTLLRSVVTSLMVGADAHGTGWAAQTLQVSVRRVVLTVVASLQVVMAVVAVFTSVAPIDIALAAGFLCLAFYAVVALRQAAPAIPLVVGMYLLGMAGYLVSGDLGSALTFAACWLINAASCVAALQVSGRPGLLLVLVPTMLMPAGILTFLPHWGWHLPVAVLVTQTSILVVARLGLPALFRFVRRADDESAAAQRATRNAEMLRSASQKIAEDARVLHDTAINTLGAIANGGVAIADLGQVREQCARDVALLEELQTADDDGPDRPASLFELFGLPGLPIRRMGLDDDEIQRITGRLQQPAIRAIVRCAREAARNAAKHSGADHVVVQLAHIVDAGRGSDAHGSDAHGRDVQGNDVQGRDLLEVTVGDSGRGFDGRFPPGRGLAESVFARAEAAAVEVELTTARGAGTSVRIRTVLSGGPTRTAARHDDSEASEASEARIVVGDVDGTVSEIHRRAGSLWGAGVTVVSVVLTVMGGTDHGLALFPMVGVMALCWAVTALVRRVRPNASGLPGYVLVLMVIGTPTVFVLSAAAVRFGSDGAVDWQALAATGPFVLFLAARPRRVVFWSGAAIWILTVVIVAGTTWPRDPNDAMIILVAGCVGVGFSSAWKRFQEIISRIGGHTAQAQQRAFDARLAADMQAAAQATFRRWLDAGLEHSMDLLRRIAQGHLSPAVVETRSLCGSEELYLRQLTLVSPRLIHLGHAVMPVLATARARDVQITVRLGERDTPDETTAQNVSQLMLGAVAVVPNGGSLTATVFPVRDGLQITLITPPASLERLARQAASFPSASLRYERLSGNDLLQLDIPKGSGTDQPHRTRPGSGDDRNDPGSGVIVVQSARR